MDYIYYVNDSDEDDVEHIILNQTETESNGAGIRLEFLEDLEIKNEVTMVTPDHLTEETPDEAATDFKVKEEASEYISRLTEEFPNNMQVQVKIEPLDENEVDVKIEPLDENQDVKICGFIIKKRTNPVEMYKCVFCDYESRNKGKVTLHVKSRHTMEFKESLMVKPIEYICGHCDKVYFLKVHLENHMPVHFRKTNIDPYFNCSDCRYKCASLQELRKHLVYHDKKRPYECNVCDYRFPTRRMLAGHIVRKHSKNAHLKKRTGKKQREIFKCNVCRRQYTQKGRLNDHMKCHTRENLFICDVCHYKSTRSDLLKRHLRTHSGEKPFKCKLCDFKTAQSCNLVRHEKIHTGDKPFKCVVCEYRCNQSGDLKKHMMKHTDQRPYKCDYCDYKVKFRMTLENHILVHHWPQFGKL